MPNVALTREQQQPAGHGTRDRPPIRVPTVYRLDYGIDENKKNVRECESQEESQSRRFRIECVMIDGRENQNYWLWHRVRV